VIVEVFVAQHQTEDPLPNQCLDPVLDVAATVLICEASEPADQSKAAINLSQQQCARVRGDVAAVETSRGSRNWDSVRRSCPVLPSRASIWSTASAFQEERAATTGFRSRFAGGTFTPSRPAE
jgi:hypothetical protein